MRAHTFQASPEYLRIGNLSSAELEKLLLRGETPDASALAGWEFRGLNTQNWSRILGIKKFVKGFYRATDDGQVYGYNIPIVQNALGEPWTPKPPSRLEGLLGRRRDGEPRRFGFFLVDKVDASSKDNHYLHSLLLDYGRGKNPVWDPTSGLRDYIVRLERGSDELLLGKAYFALGPARVNTMSYFLLERARPTDFRR